MAKYLFLDIDGVIKTDYGCFNTKSLAAISKIVKKTDVNVILSSGWRELFDEEMKPQRKCADDLVKALAQYDIELKGKTQSMSNEELKKVGSLNKIREMEIDEWLKTHPYQSFLVVDDIEIERFKDNQIVIHDKRGLNWIDVRQAISILGKEG